MRHLVGSIFFALFSILVFGTAQAADVAPAYKASPPLSPSWTGLYLGGDAGMRSTISSLNLTNQCTSVNGGPSTCGSVSNIGETLNGTGFRSGIYFGYNWQLGQWLTGLEGNVGYASQSSGEHPLFLIGPVGTANTKTTWDSAVRARVGYLVTPTLLTYVAGGAAWQHFDVGIGCGAAQGCAPLASLPGGSGWNPTSASGSFTKLGWTIGAGLEAALSSNWIARAEYCYADFGSTNFSAAATGGSIPALIFLSTTGTYEAKLQTHTATFGLAYKFGT